MENHKFVLYVDGAARGNPGPAGIGIVINNSSGELLKEVKEYLGATTNNVAEYRALLRALEEAEKMGGQELQVYVDSELVAKQWSGEYRVKDEVLKELFNQARLKAKKFSIIEVKHIKRSENKKADKLANIAINLEV